MLEFEEKNKPKEQIEQTEALLLKPTGHATSSRVTYTRSNLSLRR